MTYAAVTQLREAGYPESVIEQVTAIRRQIDECCRGRGALDETWALIDAVRSEPWFASVNLPSLTSSGEQWRRIMDFDVRPALRRLNLPILLVFGQRDRWVPIDIPARRKATHRSWLSNWVAIPWWLIIGSKRSAIPSVATTWIACDT